MVERQHPDERDVDAMFESIVARWEETAEDPAAPRAGEGEDPTAAPGAGGRPDPTAPAGPQTTGGVDRPSPPGRPATGQPPGDERGPRPASGPEDEQPVVPWRTDPTSSVADALLGTDDHPGAADEDEGFTPPPPAPLPPATDRLFWGALGGLVLGMLGLVWMVLVRPDAFWPKVLVLGLIFGGFLCLVLRQPTNRGHDPDQGARV